MRGRYRRRPNEYGALSAEKGRKVRMGRIGRIGRKGRTFFPFLTVPPFLPTPSR
jgi:hypothetical protein